MTSMPASRSARAMIFAPRSWPSRPGLATTTRILRLTVSGIGAGKSMTPRPAVARLPDLEGHLHLVVVRADEREGPLVGEDSRDPLALRLVIDVEVHAALERT